MRTRRTSHFFVTAFFMAGLIRANSIAASSTTRRHGSNWELQLLCLLDINKLYALEIIQQEGY